MNLPFFIAKRIISYKKSSISGTFLIMATIATTLSVATMLLSDIFLSGFKNKFQDKLYAFMGHIHVTSYHANPTNLLVGQPISKDPALEQYASSNDNIKQITPFIMRAGILYAKHEMEGIKLKGIEKNYKFSNDVLLTGNNIPFNDTQYARGILISKSTSNKLNIKQGDQAIIFFIEPESIFPRMRPITISGFYETGLEEIDQNIALCDLKLLQRINNWDSNTYSGYQIDLLKTNELDNTTELVNGMIPQDMQASNIKTIYGNIFSWLNMLSNNVVIIFIIMSIVATVNIISSLLLFSMERVSMTGILKALGMNDKQLPKIFLYHALIVAGIGIILGNIIALGITFLQKNYHFIKLDQATYGMSYAAVHLNIPNLLIINFGTFFICFLSLLLPLIFIKKVKIVDAINFK